MATPPLQFVPTKQEVWSANFEKLKEFYDEHGHLTLPKKDPECARLAQWLTYQRHYSKTLSKDQLQKLESINYKNTPVRRRGDDIDWEAKFSRVKGCQRASDKAIKWNGNLTLSRWLSRQKKLMRDNLLDPARKEKLLSIGVGPSRENPSRTKLLKAKFSDQWNSNYEKLKEFHCSHGHSNVPRNWKDDPPLGLWVFNQRRSFANGSLDSDRVEKLAELDFVWKRPKHHKKS